jgi:2,4-dienoyl-CoA reductase-like NADH-dependent reductase (Old Yellow Enzyme family)/thioredoxin reductase
VRVTPAVASPSDTADLDVLWQPLPLRGVTLPNRVMCSATTLQYGIDGLITDRHLAFYCERARGGVGLLFTEQLAATPLSDTAFPGSIHAYDERQIERFAALAAELEPYPTAMFAQLVAAGAKGASTAGIDDWGPVRAPSKVPAPGGEVPLPLEQPELDLIAADFARSARHVREGGLDGIEVHGAHGWLVGQFLSPFFNRRDDGYGGDIESRCRFALEVGGAIRAEVGDDFPVGLALTYDEVIGDAGITTDDTEAQLDVLAAAGVYDFFDLSIGAPHAGHLTISSMAVPTGYALPFARRAMAVVAHRAAVFVAGRVVDLATAARAVREGDADVVAMTRAHLADAHHVRKSRSGRRSEIARCIGANVCVGRALRGVQVTCVLNPATGREQALGEGTRRPAATPRRVVVVGAGPAGLRVASTAAARGHELTVHERLAAPGGHLCDLASLPTREPWLEAVEDLVAALERHGADLRLESAPDALEVAAEEPDVVVVATGSFWEATGATARRPDRPGIPGIENGLVLGLDAAIERGRENRSALGRRVVIADESGTYAPLGLAELLALGGTEVHVVTPDRGVGETMLTELELPHLLPRLGRLGVRLVTSHEIDSIDGSRVVLRDLVAGASAAIDAVDAVVLAVRRAQRDELAVALRGLVPEVVVVGDARAPRPTAAVVHEAELLARAL